MKFVASRLSEGNKIFPAEIIIEPNGINVKIPGFFSGHSRHLDFKQIGEVSVDTPLVGYSTITFYTAGTMATAHGFTKSQVMQIKDAIEEGRENRFNSNGKSDQERELELQKEIEEERLDHERRMAEDKREHEIRVEGIRSSNELVQKLNDFTFGGVNSLPETIAKDMDYCLSVAASNLSETFEVHDDASNREGQKEKYNLSEKIVSAAIMKVEQGLNKLRLCDEKNKASNYISVYQEQIRTVKIKQIKRKYDILIQKEKPLGFLWGFGIVFPPLWIWQIYKTINYKFILPKKRETEIKDIG